MMYSLHSTPPHSPGRPLLTTAGLHHRCLDGYHADSANCCLMGIVFGITLKKIITK